MEAATWGTSSAETATATGGLGGHTEATLSVTGGETLQVNVGGAGGDGSASATSASQAQFTGGSAGWNGGQCGAGIAAAEGSMDGAAFGPSCTVQGAFSSGTPESVLAVAAGGSGGASDVRDGADATADRLVVAGGGGGGGACVASDGPTFSAIARGGGGGGGSTGGTGSGINTGDGGTGGTQSTGGTGGTTGGTTATDDQGAASNASTNWDTVPTNAAAGGPGGAGYYGGGSGSEGDSECGPAGGGGGGSSYPADATILAQGVNGGNGLVTFTYTLYVPTLGTTPSSTSVTLGSSTTTLDDTATLSGGYNPTGTITFTLYNPSDTLLDTETVGILGDGSYITPVSYTLPTTGAATGTYQWDATYTGDSNNTPVTDDDNADEQVTVSSASPSLTTTPSATTVTLGSSAVTLKDTAVLSSAYNPTGTITFTLYNPSSTLVDTETVTVSSGNGSYTTPTGYTLPTTGTVTGTYQWDATYSGSTDNSGVTDSNNADEQVTVSAASPSLTTTPSTTTVTLGASAVTLKDTAVLAGGDNPTGTITFTLYNPSSTLVDTETVTVSSGNGSYTTPIGYTLPTTGTVAGTYQWDASYSGANNNLAVSDNNNANEQVTVLRAATSISTHSTIVRQEGLAGTLTFSATLTSRVTDQGISGQTISFAVTGPFAFVLKIGFASGSSCTGTTNSSGTATCTLSVANLGVLLLTPSYTASFAGNTDNAPTSATGKINLLGALL
jgi:hypothetical protein